MPIMLSVRRTKQLQSDLTACVKYRRMFTGGSPASESDIVRAALEVYRDVLKQNCVKAGKVKV